MLVGKRVSFSLVGFFTVIFLVSACDGNQTSTSENLTQSSSSETPSAQTLIDSTSEPVSLFLEESLVESITEEPCTLSGGSETTCYRITVRSLPLDHETGPWCPGTITDTAEAGGIWIEGGETYDVDGSFVEDLDVFYSDDNWKLYEEDGTIRVTGTAEQCAAAARPDVDEAYQNYCVQCLPEYIEEGIGVFTYLIPVTPVEQSTTESSNRRQPFGVALNGVTFDQSAPTDAILSAYTLAPFDDCGGHINLNGGYHYHAHTGCSKEIEQSDNHAPMIGYALDGFPIYALMNNAGEDPTTLDQCRGEYDDVRGYHYHAGEPGSNSIIGCFKGEQGCVFDGEGEGQTCDAAATSDRPGRPEGRPDDPAGERPAGPSGNSSVPPGFSEAAEQLGVTPDELMTALGRPPFDLDAAAVTLGVTVEALEAALPAPPPR